MRFTRVLFAAFVLLAGLAMHPDAAEAARGGATSGSCGAWTANWHIDGLYGPNTREAVRRFQRARGLTVDGIAGPHTLRALRRPVGRVLMCGLSGRDVRGLQQALAANGYWRDGRGKRHRVVARPTLQAAVLPSTPAPVATEPAPTSARTRDAAIAEQATEELALLPACPRPAETSADAPAESRPPASAEAVAVSAAEAPVVPEAEAPAVPAAETPVVPAAEVPAVPPAEMPRDVATAATRAPVALAAPAAQDAPEPVATVAALVPQSIPSVQVIPQAVAPALPADEPDPALQVRAVPWLASGSGAAGAAGAATTWDVGGRLWLGDWGIAADAVQLPTLQDAPVMIDAMVARRFFHGSATLFAGYQELGSGIDNLVTLGASLDRPLGVGWLHGRATVQGSSDFGPELIGDARAGLALALGPAAIELGGRLVHVQGTTLAPGGAVDTWGPYGSLQLAF